MSMLSALFFRSLVSRLGCFFVTLAQFPVSLYAVAVTDVTCGPPRCFSSPVGQEIQQPLHSFTAKIHPGRWGTLAFSIPQLLAVEQALRWGWSKQSYLRGEVAQAAVNDVGERVGDIEDSTVLAESIDKTISSPTFWGWVAMMEALCSVLREVPAYMQTLLCKICRYETSSCLGVWVVSRRAADPVVD